MSSAELALHGATSAAISSLMWWPVMAPMGQAAQIGTTLLMAGVTGGLGSLTSLASGAQSTRAAAWASRWYVAGCCASLLYGLGYALVH